MGCPFSCFAQPRKSQSDEAPVKKEAREREPPTLCFGMEELDAFGHEYMIGAEKQNVAAMQQQLGDVVTDETTGRTKLVEDEDTERGYVLFEVEEQWEQAKLEDDLRLGVIAPNRFIVPHTDEFTGYTPPFVPSPSVEHRGSFGQSLGRAANSFTRKGEPQVQIDEFGEQFPPRKASIRSADRYAGVLDNDDALSDENDAVLTAFRSAMGTQGRREEDARPRPTGHRRERSPSVTSVGS